MGWAVPHLHPHCPFVSCHAMTLSCRSVPSSDLSRHCRSGASCLRRWTPLWPQRAWPLGRLAGWPACRLAGCLAGRRRDPLGAMTQGGRPRARMAAWAAWAALLARAGAASGSSPEFVAGSEAMALRSVAEGACLKQDRSSPADIVPHLALPTDTSIRLQYDAWWHGNATLAASDDSDPGIHLQFAHPSGGGKIQASPLRIRASPTPEQGKHISLV